MKSETQRIIARILKDIQVEQAVRTIIEENLSGYIEEAINFEIKER